MSRFERLLDDGEYHLVTVVRLDKQWLERHENQG
jgi:hypothetical protein